MPKGEKSPIKTVEAKGEVISNVLADFENLRSLPPVEKTDTEECKKRVKMFFDFCIQTGRTPTNELLCLSLGRTRQTLLDWQADEKSENGRIVEQAKTAINALLTDLAVTGQANSIYIMFSQKVHQNYVEPKQEITVELKPQSSVAPISKEEIFAEFGSGNIVEEIELLPTFPLTDDLEESEEN